MGELLIMLGCTFITSAMLVWAWARGLKSFLVAATGTVLTSSLAWRWGYVGVQSYLHPNFNALAYFDSQPVWFLLVGIIFLGIGGMTISVLVFGWRNYDPAHAVDTFVQWRERSSTQTTGAIPPPEPERQPNPEPPIMGVGGPRLRYNASQFKIVK